MKNHLKLLVVIFSVVVLTITGCSRSKKKQETAPATATTQGDKGKSGQKGNQGPKGKSGQKGKPGPSGPDAGEQKPQPKPKPTEPEPKPTEPQEPGPKPEPKPTEPQEPGPKPEPKPEPTEPEPNPGDNNACKRDLTPIVAEYKDILKDAPQPCIDATNATYENDLAKKLKIASACPTKIGALKATTEKKRDACKNSCPPDAPPCDTKIGLQTIFDRVEAL